MEVVWGDSGAMETYYERIKVRRGNSAGGQFTGGPCRQIISKKSLQELQQLLGHDGKVFVDYLASLRELYEVLVSKEIAPDYDARISKFTKAFEAVHQLHSLPETLKIHILKSHVGDYLSLSGVTCWSNSDEMVETCHQLLDRRHRKHQTKKTKNLVGAHKEKMSKFAFNTFNAKGLRSKD